MLLNIQNETEILMSLVPKSIWIGNYHAFGSRQLILFFEIYTEFINAGNTAGLVSRSAVRSSDV